MKNYDSAIFDLDGTLLDSQAGAIKSLADTAAVFGLAPVPESKYDSFIGPPIERSLQEHYGLDAAQTKEAAAKFRKIYEERYLFEATVYDGVTDMLARLKSGGVSLAIATYKRHDYAVKIIRHFNLDQYCYPCLGSDTENRTTKSTIIRACMSEMKAGALRAVYVGDTEHDQRGAEEAGTAFIGVTYGFGYTQSRPGFADTADQIAEFILGGR